MFDSKQNKFTKKINVLWLILLKKRRCISLHTNPQHSEIFSFLNIIKINYNFYFY